MAITRSDVRAHLDPEEVDYPEAARLGPEALPFLDELVRGEDPMLAAKAAYLASLIPGEQRTDILNAAATSPEPTVRVAAATGLGNLDEPSAGTLADNLLADGDLGVRKQALVSVRGFGSAEMAQRVRRMAEADPEPVLRDLAADSLGTG